MHVQAELQDIRQYTRDFLLRATLPKLPTMKLLPRNGHPERDALVAIRQRYGSATWRLKMQSLLRPLNQAQAERVVEQHLSRLQLRSLWTALLYLDREQHIWASCLNQGSINSGADIDVAVWRAPWTALVNFLRLPPDRAVETLKLEDLLPPAVMRRLRALTLHLNERLQRIHTHDDRNKRIALTHARSGAEISVLEDCWRVNTERQTEELPTRVESAAASAEQAAAPAEQAAAPVEQAPAQAPTQRTEEAQMASNETQQAQQRRAVLCAGCRVPLRYDITSGKRRVCGVVISDYLYQQPFEQATLDRRIPGARDGKYTPGNTQLCCQFCQTTKWDFTQREFWLLRHLIQQQLRPGHAAFYTRYTARGGAFGRLINWKPPTGSAARRTASDDAQIEAWVNRSHPQPDGSRRMLSQAQRNLLRSTIQRRWVGTATFDVIGTVRYCIRDSFGLVVPLRLCDLDRVNPGSRYTGKETEVRLCLFSLNRLRLDNRHDHRPASVLAWMAGASAAERRRTCSNAREARRRATLPQSFNPLEQRDQQALLEDIGDVEEELLAAGPAEVNDDAGGSS